MSHPYLITPTCRNLKNVFDRFASLGKLSCNDFERACNHLGLKISAEGRTSLFMELVGSDEKKLVYHEFCLIIACHLINSHHPIKVKASEYEVFLGGACNPTTWRRDVAVPFLDAAGISYYNPQVSTWYPELVEIEAQAKASSHTFLFVFEPWKTRGIASFVEVAFLVAQYANVVLVLLENSPNDSLVIAGEQIFPYEQACLQQARDYMCQFSKFRDTPVFYQLPEALEYVKKTVLEHRELVQKRKNQNFSSLPTNEQQLIERISMVRKVFNSLKTVKPGCVSISQARYGLHCLNADFPCYSTFREDNLKTLNFEQFCLAFACYLFQHIGSVDSNAVGASEENRENAAVRPYRSLRHTHSLYAHRGDGVPQQPLRNLKPSVSLDHGERKKSMDSPRSRRLPHSMSFHEQTNMSTAVPVNRSMNAFMSWVNGIRKRRLLDHYTFTDEPSCQPTYDLYLSGVLFDGLSGPELRSEEDPLSPLRSLSLFMANDPNGHDSVGTIESEQLRFWARTHSRLLLYVVSSNSFSLPILMEAAFAIGCGLPVVLCIEQLTPSESTPGTDESVRVTALSRANRDRSSRSDWLLHKRLHSGRRVESLESQRIKAPSSSCCSSSTSSLSSHWIKQASCPNEGLAGFNLSDSNAESNSDSVATSLVCPSAISTALNPSVDSGIGLNSDSTELFDGPAESDGTGIDLVRNDRRVKSTSISPLQEKSILPNLWEDNVQSLIVSTGAAKDHNRGRMYLISIAKEMHIPYTGSIQEAVEICRSRLTGPDPRSSTGLQLSTMPL